MHPAEKINMQRQRREDAECLAAIKARIRRSRDDPRPALTGAEVAEDLEAVFAQARRGVRAFDNP